MKRFAFILALLSIAAFGCKQQFWTFLPQQEDETIAVSEPPKEEPRTGPPKIEPAPEPIDPKVEPETPKQVILILGIDGMD
jgi:hypothetical protein